MGDSSDMSSCHLLSLPEDVLDLILRKISIKERLEVVQRTCLAFRAVLKRPRLGSYGVVKINPPGNNLNRLQKYEDLSEWLRYRVQGIDKLILQVDRDNEAFFISHLVFWLMGRYQELQFGIHIQMQFQSRVSECLFQPVIMDSLSSQLVSLEVCSDGRIWPGLFQLRSLTRLCLTLVRNHTVPGHGAAHVAALRLPETRELPSLKHLELANCTASCAPLLEGASLPVLTSVVLSGCYLPGTIDITSIAALPTLRDMAVYACTLQQTEVSLKQLERLHVGHMDLPGWQSAVLGSTCLSELIITGYQGDGSDLLETIQQLPSLKYIVAPMPELTPNTLFHLGRIQGIIEGRGGMCSLLQFAF